MFIAARGSDRRVLKSIEDQVSTDIRDVVQASKSDLMARGVAINLLQMESYAPGRQVIFESLNYVVDIRGDLIFNGFETTAIAPPAPMNMTEKCRRTIFRRWFL